MTATGLLAAPTGVALENPRTYASPLDLRAPSRPPRAVRRRTNRRSERRQLKRGIWVESKLKGPRLCGRFPRHGEMVGVKVGRTPSGDVAAGYSGLMTCGSVWACPTCSAHILRERSRELAAGVQAWRGKGQVYMVTLTMRHRRGQALSRLWDALSYAWSKAVVNGKQWATDKALLDLAGFVRTVEVTHGRNGWHVHIHALLFVGEPSETAAGAVWARMQSRWTRALERKGLSAVPEAQEFHRVSDPTADVARYLAKADVDYALDELDALRQRTADSVGLEMAGSSFKAARAARSRTPWGIFADVMDDGCAESLDLWHEYEDASQGRRQLTWSRGLRELLKLGEESSDEDVAATDGEGVEVLRLPRDTWLRVRDEADLYHGVLEAAEDDLSGDRLRAYLRQHGLIWVPPRNPLDALPDPDGPVDVAGAPLLFL